MSERCKAVNVTFRNDPSHDVVWKRLEALTAEARKEASWVREPPDHGFMGRVVDAQFDAGSYGRGFSAS
jgi:hypothetical protein